MQEQSRNQATRSQRTSESQSGEKQPHVARSVTGEDIARWFKYYKQMHEQANMIFVPFKLVPCKSLYRKNRKAFDRFAAAASKNNFDVCSYMKFCVQVCGIDESGIGKSILSSAVLSRYEEHMKERLRLRHIYKWFMKSVKFIAETCVEEDYFTAKDYLRMLIDTHQIGACIMSGKISLYFFAAIPNFNRAISHLDYFSRLELVPLAEHFDIYHSDVNKAYMQIRNVKVNPVDLVDRMIEKLRAKKKRDKKL